MAKSNRLVSQLVHFFSKVPICALFPPLSPMQTVLTIAGFDPSSGAGVTAGLMVFAAHSLFGTACITTLTVQSTQGVRSTHPTAATVVQATLDCLEEDLPPAGIKIGMMATKDNASVICNYLDKHQQEHWHLPQGWIPVVLDPVLRSTSGRELLEPAGVTLMRDLMLSQVDWITPNLAELAILSGQVELQAKTICRVPAGHCRHAPPRARTAIAWDSSLPAAT